MGAYLGSHELGAELTFEVVFVPAPTSVAVEAAELTLIHQESGAVHGPYEGVEFAANSFRTVAQVNVGGNWRVRWTSTPPGAVTDDRVYIDD
jgi:hypothetical protein